MSYFLKKEDIILRLLFFVLNKTEKLDEVLSEFANNNINGATVIESVGMARVLNNKDLPMLASLRAFLNPERKQNYVIFTVIKNNQLEKIVEIIESVVGDLSQKDTGIVFSLPVDYTRGMV
jgi:nitrogen regulatory protein PII